MIYFFMILAEYAEKNPVSTDTGFTVVRPPENYRQASLGTLPCSGKPDGF